MGFQIRHASPYVELAKRIHAGQIGAAGLRRDPLLRLGHQAARAGPTRRPVERRLRNWVHDIALSGDIIVEQNIHIIDVTNWLLKAHPVKAVGSAGRAGRTDQGDCSSHFNCVFTYPGNVHVSFASTQFGRAAWGVGMQYYGTKGCAEARYDAPVRISGEEQWEYPGPQEARARRTRPLAVTGVFRGALDDADPNKQKAFIESITSGNAAERGRLGSRVGAQRACSVARRPTPGRKSPGRSS